MSGTHEGGRGQSGTEDVWGILEGQDYPRLWWELIENNYTALVENWLADTSNWLLQEGIVEFFVCYCCNWAVAGIDLSFIRQSKKLFFYAL